MTGKRPDARGVNINESSPFGAALSALVAGSTHYLAAIGNYNVWADQPWLFFITAAGGANDPPGLLPATQGALGGFPGVFLAAYQVLEVQIDHGIVTVGATSITSTGFRAVRLGAAGTFYCCNFFTRVL